MLRNLKEQKLDYFPFVSIIISAHNEADNIRDTIRNKLELNYPAEKREVIVVSDGSTDGTDKFVKEFESQGVRLIRQEPRAGKTAAINKAVTSADGEILVFADANSIYEPGALIHLIRNFTDAEVGYVTGKMIYTGPDGNAIGDGCSAYMRYENFLRGLETRAGSVVGVDGGIDAVRKNLYVPMRAEQIPDFVLPLTIISQGYRVVYEPRALLKEPFHQKTGDEYRMRVRVALRSFWALLDMRQLLSIKKYKLFALQLWSHKLLRYLCFSFLFTAWMSNLLLLPQGGIYQIAFSIQSSAYLVAIITPVIENWGIKVKYLYLLYYFLLINAASAHAFLKFILGQKQIIWTPRKG
jgi:cellulose synthase/poly-beta-1,6-N-acetylglucosamine synthase-like glycosyltransferase